MTEGKRWFMERSDRGTVARWRTWGSFDVEDEDGTGGNGEIGFEGKGRLRVWLRATVP